MYSSRSRIDVSILAYNVMYVTLYLGYVVQISRDLWATCCAGRKPACGAAGNGMRPYERESCTWLQGEANESAAGRDIAIAWFGTSLPRFTCNKHTIIEI